MFGIRIFLVNPWCSQVELDIERSNKWIKNQLKSHILTSYVSVIYCINHWILKESTGVIHLSIDSIVPRIFSGTFTGTPREIPILEISSRFSQQCQTEVSADLTELGWPPEDSRDFFSDLWTTESMIFM